MSDTNYKKPRIGTKVYCIYYDGIFVDTVAFLGKDSFIVDSFHGPTNEDSWEWNYCDYNIKWFTNFNKAKKALIELYKDRCDGKLKVVEVTGDWYELEEEY